MAELADAADSKSAEGNLVGVRPPLRHQSFSLLIIHLQQLTAIPTRDSRTASDGT